MKYIQYLCIISILSLNACKGNSNKEQLAVADFEENSSDTSFYQLKNPPPPPEPKQEGNKEKASANWDKKIVKTANLNAEVKDYKNFSKGLREKIKKYGGYVSNEQESTTEFKIENSMVIKVPVDQFDNAVTDILSDAATINEKQISSDDLTAEFVDGRSRLEAKKQVRLRYLELLQKAKNMSEIVEVQNEINEIQEEIEIVSGRINYLSHSSAMSTINLNYNQLLKPVSDVANEDGLLYRLKNAFSFGWHWIVELLIGIISLWPLLILIFLSIYFLRKKLIFKTK